MLAEREPLVRAAHTVLTSATSGQVGVLLAGQSGIGATSLLRAIAESVASHGAMVADWPRLPPDDPDPGTMTVAFVDDVARIGPEGDETLHAWLTAAPQRRAVITSRRGTPIPRRVGELWSSGRLERYELVPLTSAGIEAMASQLLGGPVTRGLTDYLERVSGGVPLVIRELLADGTADGVVVRSGPAWVWRGSQASVGRRFTDLIRTRLDALPDPEREALELVACVGGAPVRILLQLVSPDGLDRCERRGLIEVVDSSTLQVRPPALEIAIRTSMSAARRSVLRHRLGEILAMDPDAPDELLQRAATWSLDDGGRPSSDLAVAAAKAAVRTGDWTSAQRLARAALGTAADREARITLATALRHGGAPAEAAAILEPALDTASADSDEARRLLELAAAEKADLLQYGYDDPAAAIAVLDACPAVPGSNVLAVNRLALVANAGRHDEVIDEIERLIAEATLTDVERCILWPPLIIGLTFVGRGTDAIDHARRAVAVAPQVVDQLPFALSHMTSASFFTRMVGGWGLESLPPIGSLMIAGLVQFGLGLPLLAEGRAAEAVVEIEKGIASLEVDDSYGFLSVAYAAAAAAAVQAGDERRGIVLADLSAATPRRTTRSIEPTIQNLLLWPEFVRGGVERVATIGRALAVDYHTRGLFGAELVIRHTMLRLGVPGAGPDTDLLSRVDTPIARALAAKAAAIAAHDAAGVLAAAEQFAGFGERVVAAEIAANAHQMARASGQRTLARTAALRVRALTEGMDTSAFPRLRDWSAPVRLTRREREVVTLAAQQLSNREIAARLHTSRRTVEGHLHRAYTKLGVSDRAELRGRPLDTE